MLEFTGNARKIAHVDFARKHGMGIGHTAACFRMPHHGLPWFLDNGAFTAYRRGEEFDEVAFLKSLDRLVPTNPPLFVVCPDIVAGGMGSLSFSIQWRKRISEAGYDWLPWYLAVQDGMDVMAVFRIMREKDFAGIFVGGTVPWKKETASMWVSMAHSLGKKCHIGRVGTVADLRWARSIGADSVDSTSWAQNDTHHYVLLARKET